MVLNDKTDVDEASVDYETLIRIFDEDFPDTDPDSLDCTDILGIYLEWTNADYRRADYMGKPEMVPKVRRATSKRPWPKDRKMAHELRENHLARLHGTERERKIANRLRACGCWARLRGNSGTPSKSTDRVAESVITPTRKSKPQLATNQKLAAKIPKLGSVVMKLRNKESPPAHLKSQLSNHNVKDRHDPNSWHQVLEEPTAHSRVPPPLRLTDRHGRLHHLQNKPGSLVKETLQALQRHGQHLDAQLADAFAQTLGVERNDKSNDKAKFLIHAWNKNKQSQSGKFITNPVDVNEKPTAIKDDNFDRGTFPLAAKFQDKNEDIDTTPTDPSSVQEDSNGEI